jgi:hypothetical protein
VLLARVARIVSAVTQTQTQPLKVEIKGVKTKNQRRRRPKVEVVADITDKFRWYAMTLQLRSSSGSSADKAFSRQLERPIRYFRMARDLNRIRRQAPTRKE